ncbi:MAG: sugar phosphate nucleotidyltransferase [Bacteroidota bacterium]
MIKLIPMAGAGSRFTEKGYTTPKPLLPIMQLPMVVQASKALPEAEKNIFILRDFHVSEYKISNRILEYFPNAEIIVLEQLTEGQAVTCLMAKQFINTDEELVIGASDNGMVYDDNAFEAAKADADAIVFTFRNNPTVLVNPKAYGWVVVDGQNTVTEAKVKYDMPQPLESHAIVGAFWFKKGSDFVSAAEQMIQQNRRINNEFYVDECINDLIASGKKVKAFEVKHYICWGTPADYETFNYWEDYFKKLPQHQYGK